jgi:proton glutamate symport protein
MSLTRRVLVAILAGVGCGIAISWSGHAGLSAAAALIEPVGVLWVNAIRMTVVPLVVSLLIVSVASVADASALGRLGGRALLLFASLLGASVTIAALVGPQLFAWLYVDPETVADLSARAPSVPAAALPTMGEWFAGLIPVNPVQAAADGAMLPLVIFSLLFGLACTRIPPVSRQAVVAFFGAVSEAMLVLVRWVIALAPIGVFALMLGLSTRLGVSVAGAFGFYVLVLCAGLLLQTLALYGLVALAGGVPVARFARAVFPAQAVAFSSRSSLAALPALIEGADRRLRLPPVAAGFVLPFAVSIFKFSAPMSSTFGALFVARLYGVTLDPTQVALIAVTALLLSFSTPGIPAGNLVVLAPLFVSVGLPVEGIGMLIALDVFPDSFKTAGNVTANMAAAVVLARGPRAVH